MKKSMLRKTISLMISTLIICTSTSLFSYADEESITSELNYAENALSKYLLTYDVDTDEIYMSDSYNVYNFDKNTSDKKLKNDVFIIFEEDNIIGLLSISNIDGSYYSSFECNSYDVLQNVYDKNEWFSFVSKNGTLYIEENNTNYPVYGSDAEISYDFSVTHEKKLTKSYKLTNTVNSKSINSISYQKNLLVPIVPNDNLDGGICWASAIASKVNFLYNSTLLGTDVYYTLGTQYEGTPMTFPTWTQLGYNYYTSSCTFFNRMLNCIEIYNNIQNDNPIHVTLRNNNGGMHDVLISGLTIYTDGTGIYRLVDSNRNVYVDVIVSEDIMVADDDFVYVAIYGNTYTQWIWSFC